MASPLPTAKQSVSLTSTDARGSVRGSRIRRDPPPAVKPVTEVDPDQRDARTVLLGILTFTIALLIIGLGISSYLGWSPRQYIVRL